LHQPRPERFTNGNAIYSLKEVIKRNPDHTKSHFNLGIAYALSAEKSMQMSWSTMQDIDPGREVVKKKIQLLQQLLGLPIGNQ